MPLRINQPLALALLAFTGISAHAQLFTPLGFAPGSNSSYAFGVSADGSTVVGLSNAAFRWTRAAGFQNLGTLPGGLSSQAMAVGQNVAVVAGYSGTASNNHAFRWTPAGMQDLGTLGGGSFAFGMSGDGSLVAGYSQSGSGDRAFVYTAATGTPPPRECRASV
jgi:probable HAF family extracellular repeat protein